MNSKQRRKALRFIKSLAGRKALYVAKDGRTCPVTIVGESSNVLQLASAPDSYSYNGNRPSAFRVRIHRDSNIADSTAQVKLTKLLFA